MKKKLLPMLLLVVIVFNFILCNGVYADVGESSTNGRYGSDQYLNGEDAKKIAEEAKDDEGNTFSHESLGDSVLGMLMQSLVGAINTVPMAIQNIITLIVWEAGSGASYELFTVEKAVFNEIGLFNINVFNRDSTYSTGIGASVEVFDQHSAILKLKEQVTGWYYSIRLLAMMINLCILIYVGIRMALSTIASEQAKYKKMLINWFESMLVLFLLNYIMYAMIYIGEAIMNIIYNIRYTMIASGSEGFEEIILDKIYRAFASAAGMQYVLYSIFFWFLMAMQVKFFLTYIKRTFTICFLTVIAPLITVTYPIDKIGDGKAQAFENWFKEYLINIFIQPIHAIVYLIFVFTAGAIAERAIFVAMIFLMALGKVENIVRNIFGLTGGIKNVNEAIKGGGGKKGDLGALVGGMMKK